MPKVAVTWTRHGEDSTPWVTGFAAASAKRPGAWRRVRRRGSSPSCAVPPRLGGCDMAGHAVGLAGVAQPQAGELVDCSAGGTGTWARSGR